MPSTIAVVVTEMKDELRAIVATLSREPPSSERRFFGVDLESIRRDLSNDLRELPAWKALRRDDDRVTLELPLNGPQSPV
ncbi:hypothetical protein [Halopiger goleimassiliensis]|uniref:hypothetical protein n=1 Tax=Halopiger goleimassiliensis TaxID=1293048 RepID=UPI0012B66F5C|nr:hypothetical protein [Halopiger goleimassiliensis]